MHRVFCQSLVLFVLAPPLLAQRGGVDGRVVEQGTQSPIADAQVSVVGTGRGALTAADGRYRLRGLRGGPATLRVARLGFTVATQAVNVPDSGTVTADFTLTPAATTLSQVVVSAPAASQQARENGNTITTIAVDSIPKAPLINFSDVLQARAPGVEVEDQSGSLGAGSRIRIRGTSSISLTNEPIIVVDGVRVPNQIGNFSFQDLQGGVQSTSRFDDIDPEALESVEVLKGPAAAAVYGTQAANGVLVITTKHGRAGPPRWSTFGELGSIRDLNSYPANFGRLATGSTLANPTLCPNLAVDAGLCNQQPGLLVYRPLERLSPFVNGYKEDVGGDVAGGNDRTTYYIGGFWRRAQGTLVDDYDRHTHVQGNVAAKVTDKIELDVNGGYVQRRTGLPQNDNELQGIFGAALNGTPFAGTTHGYNPFGYPPYIQQVRNDQSVERWTGSVIGTWTATSWLTVRALTGLDLTYTFDDQFQPPNAAPPAVPAFATGLAQNQNGNAYTYTSDINAAAKYHLAPSITGTSTIGGEYLDETTRYNQSGGLGVIPGTVGAGSVTTNQFATEINSDVVNLGAFFSQQFAWRDKVYVTGSVRVDGNSAFGLKQRTTTYPSAALSYVVSDEPWFPRTDVLSSLRLRTAYGETGQQPAFRLAETYFSSASAFRAGANQPGLILTQLGNANLQPERASEYEIGFDAGWFRERLKLAASYYTKERRNEVIAVPVEYDVGIFNNPVAAPNFEQQNIGHVHDDGFELALDGTIVRSRAVDADLSVSAGWNNNRLMAAGKTAINLIGGFNGQVEKDSVGFPIGSYFAVPYTFSDKHHTGIITPDDITYGSQPVYLGSPFPRFELGLSPSLTFFRLLRVGATFNDRAGIKNYNLTEEFRCSASANYNCRANNDAKAPLWEQARAVASEAAAGFGIGAGASDAGYIENADFWKLRELTITLIAPRFITDRIHASSATFTIAGRNLVTWTRYSGIDPEVNFNAGGLQNNGTGEFDTAPLQTTWSGRFSITF